MYPLFEPRVASGFKMFFIRILGEKRIIGKDQKITTYRFKGITYIDKWRER